MEAIHEAPAVSSSTADSTAPGNNVTPPAPKEALTQWIVDTLVSEVVSDISADGLMTRVLQSDAAAERVEALTGQLKQKLRAHIEQQALDELEAEFAGDLEVLNRWPEAEGTTPASPAERLPDPSAAAQSEETVRESHEPAAPASDTADASPADTTQEHVALEDVAPEDVAPEDVAPEDVAPEDVARETMKEPKEAEDMVEDLVQSFGAFPDDPTEDASATFTAAEGHTIENELDDAVFPETSPDVSLEATAPAPEVSDKVVDRDGATSDDGVTSDGVTSDATAPEVTHEAATTPEEPYSDENPRDDQIARQTNERGEDGAAEAAPLHDDTDTPVMTGDPFDAAMEELDLDTAEPSAEQPDFSPIDWDVAADTDTVDTSDTEPFTAPPATEGEPLSVTDENGSLDDTFFDGDFFPDMPDGEEVTSADGDAAPTADGATVDLSPSTVATDEILFTRALIGGTADARATLRKTFTHAAYRLIEWPTFDVLVEAVGVREDKAEGAGGDTLAKVLQLVPGTLPVIPVRDSHPMQSVTELRASVDEVGDVLQDALNEQAAQEAWHMSVLMDKEDVRRYVVDHHAPVREHLKEMRGKPQGVARFIKKKMVESINEEVDRLADECTEAVVALIEEHGNDVTKVAHTPGRDGDYYHLAQIAGLFDSESDEALVALTSELVDAYGMYGFIFRPEGPSRPRHFSMVFPEV